MMNYDHAVVLGLAGQACTGKTITAEGIAPIGQVLNDTDDLLWSHLYFALPLYRMVSARQKIEGNRARDRIAFELHETLYDLFGKSVMFGSLPTYDEFVELVEHATDTFCEPEGQKARQYMQEMGALCRTYDPDCFVDWMQRRIRSDFMQWKTSMEAAQDVQVALLDEPPKTYHWGVVVSDVRYPNEAQMISEQPNGVLIKLTAQPETLARRASARDGVVMTPEQAAHESEKAVDLIPNEYFDAVLETDNLTVAQQVAEVRSIVDQKIFGRHPLAKLMKGAILHA